MIGRCACLLVLLGGSLPAWGAKPAVEVLGDRVTLGEVLPDVSGESAELDLGPSPEPGETRTLSRSFIRSRLRQAMVATPRARIPKRIRVYRPGQRLSELEVGRWVRAALEDQLPSGAVVRGIMPGSGAVLEPGRVSVTLRAPARWRQGRQSVPVELSTPGGSVSKLLVTVDLSMQRPEGAVVVRRGKRISVVARAPGVVIRTKGVAQKDGALGDLVPVLASAGRRVLQARVVGPETVEVEP